MFSTLCCQWTSRRKIPNEIRKYFSCLSSNENFPFGAGRGESQESLRQQIKSKMKYANVIIFIRECLWQKAINFSSASWHFNKCITCFSQMIIFCVFHLRWQSIIFFSIASCYFSKLSLSEECNGLWLKFHSEKLSEIHVVYLMGKIIARQMKQSMTHSNQKEWRETQVSKEVRLFILSFAAITRLYIYLLTRSLSHLTHPQFSYSLTHSLRFP